MKNEIAVHAAALSLPGAWLAKRGELLAKAKGITAVTSDAQVSESSALQTEISRTVRELESRRKDITRQLDEAKKTIMAHESELAADLTTELARIKQLNNAYVTGQARKAEEERKRVEAETRKLAEAQAAQEREAEEERKRKEAEAQSVFGSGAAVATEPPPDAPLPMARPIIPPSRPFMPGSRVVEKWKFEVVREPEVPREFLSLDESKIKAFLAGQKALGRNIEDLTVPGLRLYKEMDVQAR